MRCTVLSAAAICLVIATSAQAMNWEGHDGWPYEPDLFQPHIEATQRPAMSPPPTCAEREAMNAGNPYEQIAIAGKNCKAGEQN